MKLRILSDLHLEFAAFPTERNLGEDVLVLAGDIGVGTAGIEWAKRTFDRPVIYVLGNHEFYGHDFDALLDEARACAAGSSVHLLENDAVVLGGIRFIGATLWTDFLLFGEARRQTAMDTAKYDLNDYAVIRRNGRTLRPQDTLERCELSQRWLADEIANSAGSALPLVVVTHTAPTPATISPRYVGMSSNAAFHNDADHLIRPPVRAWIHGHTHHSCRVAVNGIPVISNQRGYPRERTGFDPNLLFEIASGEPCP